MCHPRQFVLLYCLNSRILYSSSNICILKKTLLKDIICFTQASAIYKPFCWVNLNWLGTLGLIMIQKKLHIWNQPCRLKYLLVYVIQYMWKKSIEVNGNKLKEVNDTQPCWLIQQEDPTRCRFVMISAFFRNVLN